jgi:hypothetical protein
MKNLRIALFIVGALALMAAGVLINGNQINPASNISIWNLAATYGVTGSTGTFTGALSALSGAFSGSVTASSGTFTATGGTQYSIQTSSGILINAGSINAPYHIGNGSLLTGIIAQIWNGGTVSNTSTFQSSVTVQGNFGAPTINSSSTYSGTGTITNAWSWLSGSAINVGSGSAFTLQAGSTGTLTGKASVIPPSTGLVNNWEIMVASADVVNVSTLTFTGLQSSTTYKITADGYMGATASYWAVAFNNTYNGVYNFSSDAPGITQANGTGTYGAPLYCDSGPTKATAGSPLRSDYLFGYYGGQVSLVSGGVFGCRSGDALCEPCRISVHTNSGFAGLTSITIQARSDYLSSAVANTAFSGHFEIWQRVTHP